MIEELEVKEEKLEKNQIPAKPVPPNEYERALARVKNSPLAKFNLNKDQTKNQMNVKVLSPSHLINSRREFHTYQSTNLDLCNNSSSILNYQLAGRPEGPKVNL